jgi:hypothetical protein
VHTDKEHHIPTSVVLEGLLDQARKTEDVTLAWILGHLKERSFGTIILVLGLIGILPGVSALVALLLAIPAVEMMLGRPGPSFPRFVAQRPLPADKVDRLLRRALPALRWLEGYSYPRWHLLFEATRHVVALVLLLLGFTLLTPVPLSNVVPALVVVAISLAFLERDGLLLTIALAAAAVVLGAMVFTIWELVRLGMRLGL